MSFAHDMFNLEGKVAVAIGAGGVLASAMARGLAKAGAKVAVLDLNPDNAEKVASDIKTELKGEALAVKVDATSKSDLQASLDEIIAAWGQVDILINAPGINSATPFFEITEEEYDKILKINLKSMFLACQIYGKQMVDHGKGGSIINISSVSSSIPLSRVFTYSLSKAGVNSITQFLAREWALNKVRVNAIAPGFFPAEQNRKILTQDRVENIFRHTPMNRFGEPEELVSAVIWLSSERASSFVTGAIIRVDGGFTAMTI